MAERMWFVKGEVSDLVITEIIRASSFIDAYGSIVQTIPGFDVWAIREVGSEHAKE